ncbi:MAG TPA: choice-of-anchor D domain-containing protein [Myxococcales bacterium]|jgi:hypothetical protein
MSNLVRAAVVVLVGFAIACGGASAPSDSGSSAGSTADSGTANDAGTVASDAGASDAGTTISDAGTGLPDAGAAPPDAGTIGGGGGGGGIIAPPGGDGPSQFLFNSSGTTLSADINFDALKNTAPGGIAIGKTRTALEFVFNNSKKTDLVISSISIVGAAAGDFSVSANDVAAAEAAPLPANKNASVLLNVTFSPAAEGARTAALQVVSNAGTATANLSGTGLRDAPEISPIGPLSFVAGSAFQTVTVRNLGGQALIVSDLQIQGDTSSAFQFDVANAGQSNCHPGVAISPLGDCLIAVGLTAGATPPASAKLVLLSNDPATPELDVPLTLTP